MTEKETAAGVVLTKLVLTVCRTVGNMCWSVYLLGRLRV
jgi:hypothetical protein